MSLASWLRYSLGYRLILRHCSQSIVLHVRVAGLEGGLSKSHMCQNSPPFTTACTIVLGLDHVADPPLLPLCHAGLNLVTPNLL